MNHQATVYKGVGYPEIALGVVGETGDTQMGEIAVGEGDESPVAIDTGIDGFYYIIAHVEHSVSP